MFQHDFENTYNLFNHTCISGVCVHVHVAVISHNTFVHNMYSYIQKLTFRSIAYVMMRTYCTMHMLCTFLYAPVLKCLGCFAPVPSNCYFTTYTDNNTHTHTHPNPCTRNLTIWFGFCFYLFIYFHARIFIVAPSFMFAAQV